ncbi:AraC family transcriptional regulator [Pseudomonas fluorescens]|nr:AraC family transcriptional regulator [Pseudomonas fluorescens]
MLTRCVGISKGERILKIRCADSALCLMHRDSSVCWCVPSGWQGLLVFRPGLQVVSGDAGVLPFSEAGLVKLQFFIDQGVNSNIRSARGLPCVSLRNNSGMGCSAQEFESWYLTLALQNRADYQAFARELRCSESYRLLGFLLEQGSTSEKLQDLAGRYGVSVSHFRRLCRQALGGAAKSELREWRTARALLCMADGVNSLTSIALEFGYASSSHFSKEIRELVGVAPSSLIDITRLSSE